jgi:hypothetical protein
MLLAVTECIHEFLKLETPGSWFVVIVEPGAKKVAEDGVAQRLSLTVSQSGGS